MVIVVIVTPHFQVYHEQAWLGVMSRCCLTSSWRAVKAYLAALNKMLVATGQYTQSPEVAAVLN